MNGYPFVIKKLTVALLLVGTIQLMSCSKGDFLGKKPNDKLIIPASLSDAQSVLENNGLMNRSGDMPEAGSGDFFLSGYAAWQAMYSVWLRNAYLWKEDIYEGQGEIPDWNILYKQIAVTNIVLEGVAGVPVSNSNVDSYHLVKGWALFARGWAFYNLAQEFAPVYEKEKENNLPGIPLKLKTDVSEPAIRATLKVTYDRIIADITESAGLLPDKPFPKNPNRPNKAAAFGALARIYLNMRLYDKALEYATKSLDTYNILMDYNAVKEFTIPNIEMLYACEQNLSNAYLFFWRTNDDVIVDSVLYRSYASYDLRRDKFFTIYNGRVNINQNYDGGTGNCFTGLATDEMYLIKAECLARQEQVDAAMSVLNQLLVRRYQPGFPLLAASTPEEAKKLILEERRKELVFRSIRWQDLRRLNKENAGITLQRVVNGQIFMLPPNDPRYVLPIPPDEIRISNIPQNVRH